MKQNEYMNGVHIGEMIKNVAFQQRVPSKEIAEAGLFFYTNASKLFHKKDMDIEAVIRISCRLGYNLVEALAEQYLAHIPRIISGRVNYSLTLDTKNLIIQAHEGNCDFLKDVYIGKHIRDVSKKNGWNTVEMGKKLNCAPNSISDLYRKKTLTLKKIFWITDVLRHHLVDEVYLSRMCIAPVHTFDKCIITLTGKQVLIKKPEDSNFLIRYTRDDDEKKREIPYKNR